MHGLKVKQSAPGVDTTCRFRNRFLCLAFVTIQYSDKYFVTAQIVCVFYSVRLK